MPTDQRFPKIDLCKISPLFFSLPHWKSHHEGSWRSLWDYQWRLSLWDWPFERPQKCYTGHILSVVFDLRPFTLGQIHLLTFTKWRLRECWESKAVPLHCDCHGSIPMITMILLVTYLKIVLIKPSEKHRGQCCSEDGKAVSCDTTIPWGLWFKSWYPHFRSSYLLCTWESSRWRSKSLGSWTRVGDVNKAPDSWLCPGPVPAFVGTDPVEQWIQWTEDASSLCLSLTIPWFLLLPYCPPQTSIFQIITKCLCLFFVIILKQFLAGKTVGKSHSSPPMRGLPHWPQPVTECWICCHRWFYTGMSFSPRVSKMWLSYRIHNLDHSTSKTTW